MQSLKREAVLFDFFNGIEADGTPRVASFRYYKTDGTVGEKLNCTRSFEDVSHIIARPQPEFPKGGPEVETVKKRDTPHLKSNHMIRIRFTTSQGETDFRNLKIKLLTHYKPQTRSPRGSSEWFEIIHPSR